MTLCRELDTSISKENEMEHSLEKGGKFAMARRWLKVRGLSSNDSGPDTKRWWLMQSHSNPDCAVLCWHRQLSLDLSTSWVLPSLVGRRWGERVSVLRSREKASWSYKYPIKEQDWPSTVMRDSRLTCRGENWVVGCTVQWWGNT